MSFQKCPICNGTGNDPFIVTGSQIAYPCPTCKGTRIISELTGIPPVLPEKHNLFEPVEPCNADVQNAFACNEDYRNADLKATSDAFNGFITSIPFDEIRKNNSTQTPTQDVSHIQSRESQV